MYADETLTNYITRLAARQSTPGGGSASALCGAIGTSLIEMVCNFTLKNKKYQQVEKDILNYLSTLEKIREAFVSLIDEDIQVYSKIQAAFKTRNKKIIDKALKNGYYISLKVCELSKSALEIARKVSFKGNSNLITDVGCGAEMLNASFNSGIFNCRINLKGIADKNFVRKGLTRLNGFKDVVTTYRDTVLVAKERMDRI